MGKAQTADCVTDFFYSFHTHLLSASLCRQTSLCDVKGEDNLETDKLYHFLTV